MTFSTRLDDIQAQARELLKINFYNLPMTQLQQHHARLDKISDRLSRTSISCKTHEQILTEIGIVKSRCKDILHSINIPTAQRRTEPHLTVVSSSEAPRPATTSQPRQLAAVG